MVKQLTDQQKRKLLKLGKVVKSGNVAILDYLFELEEKLDAEIPEIKDVISRVKGDNGDDGYTPIAGKDYYTEKEKEVLVNELLSRVIIPKPQDGFTPIAGKDYPSREQIIDYINKLPKPEKVDYDRIVFDVIKLIPEPKQGRPGNDGSPDTAEDVRKKLESLSPDERLDIQYIKGTDEFMEVAKVVKNGAFNPTMGPSFADIQLLKNRLTTLESAPSGSGSGFTFLTATGTIDGTNVTFTFTSKPVYIVSDGAWYRENHNWTWSGSTATLTIPPSDDIWGFR